VRIFVPALLAAPRGLGPAEIAVVLFIFGLWIWALVDCATKEPDTGNTKVVWVLIIALTHFIGALTYALVRRPRRVAELGC